MQSEHLEYMQRDSLRWMTKIYFRRWKVWGFILASIAGALIATINTWGALDDGKLEIALAAFPILMYSLNVIMLLVLRKRDHRRYCQLMAMHRVLGKIEKAEIGSIALASAMEELDAVIDNL